TADLSGFDGVVICTPAHLHIPMAQHCAQEGVHVLIEKPLSVNLPGVGELKATVKKKGIVAGVAYVLRHSKGVSMLKEKLQRGQIGEVKMATWVSGQDFRIPRPDYRQIYYAKKATGGGCILDALSHQINLVEMFLGREKQVYAIYDRLELTGVECEDATALISRFQGGQIVSYAINQFQKPNASLLQFIGTGGNLIWDGISKEVQFCDNFEAVWQVQKYEEERDEQFIAQANNFLDAIEGRCRIATTLEEAEQTLRVCLAVLESGREGKIAYHTKSGN
ncbi:MAG: Gfo/Idh/MocA family oxidoreductase, partial [Candidatus Latescibacteria bacterium]|nr:Gfo/Idh/MocA family oxidoreductase [Candidatus Latescibacterota bacterium]